jgi:hypothetical protein
MPLCCGIALLEALFFSATSLPQVSSHAAFEALARRRIGNSLENLVRGPRWRFDAEGDLVSDADAVAF